MKLTEREEAIIAACENEANLSIEKIAKKAAVPAHSVRYALNSLERRGILKQRAFLDSFRLGAQLDIVFIRLLPDRIAARKSITSFLEPLPEVSFISELSGTFNLWLELRTLSPSHLNTFLKALSESVGDVFHEICVLPQLELYEFSMVRHGAPSTKVFHIKATHELPSLDETDWKILGFLARRWPKSMQELARHIGAPATTIEYRVRRLQDEGYILGSRYWVNLRAVDTFEYVHIVRTRSINQKLQDRLVEFSWSEASVSSLRVTLGSWNYIFDNHYSSDAESMAFAERLLGKYGDKIASIETIQVLNFKKISDCTVLPGNNGRTLSKSNASRR